MKKIILIILLYLSIINITYAIPIPALVIWWDYILLAIPVILWVFSTIYFYFKKYIFWINVYLSVFSIFLYFIHFNITKEIFFFKKEYLLFGIVILAIWLIYKFKKLNILNYLIVIFLIWINFFLIKIDYNLYEFIQIANKVEQNMYSNIKITNILYKDNFISIYYNDIETKKVAYTVIWIWEDVSKCVKKWKYNICNWWDIWLSKWFSSIVYKVIQE